MKRLVAASASVASVILLAIGAGNNTVPTHEQLLQIIGRSCVTPQQQWQWFEANVASFNGYTAVNPGPIPVLCPERKTSE